MKKILIIDDDHAFQKTLTEALRALSYEVESAYDGEEGLIKAQTLLPDLVLLDIKMPKLDGLAMLKELQAEKKDGEKVAVIITSNSSLLDNISEGLELGVKGYIIKSNESLATIVKTVESTLNPKTRGA